MGKLSIHRPNRSSRSLFLLGLVVTLALSGPACQKEPSPPPPPELHDLIGELSEPGGYFDTDNLISNETSYIQVIDRLAPMGGAYIGVGPQQNFNYIGRIRPRWAFILDIRRENMLAHLLFNAIFARAETPYQYLCWLLSRPARAGDEPPVGLELEDIVSAVEKVASRAEVFEANLKTLLDHIKDGLGMDLVPEDEDTIRGIYASFFHGQLDIRFHSHGRLPRSYHPTYRQLLVARAPNGRPGHFLASFEDYSYVRELAGSGRLVPIVGDFAGPHALRSIGEFLKERKVKVSAFYVSNVEFYLLRAANFQAYVENLRSLPFTDESLFIRAYFDYGLGHPARLPGHRSAVILQRMPSFLKLFDLQAYRSYWDICTMDYIGIQEGKPQINAHERE